MITRQLRKTAVAVAVTASIVGFAGTSQADTLSEIYRVGQSGVNAGQASQKRVSKLADETYDRFQDYRRVLKSIEGLKVHNARLDKVIADQQERIDNYDSQIAGIGEISRQMLPLADRMLNALGEFVQADVPLRLTERTERIESLRANLDDSKYSDSEKFRQVLEAYSIETEYGQRIDVYDQTIDLDGRELKVTILQMGRTALLFQTGDQTITGAWDKQAGSWVTLPDTPYKAAVRKGIRIANNEAVKDIMVIPVSAPEGA